MIGHGVSEHVTAEPYNTNVFQHHCTQTAGTLRGRVHKLQSCSASQKTTALRAHVILLRLGLEVLKAGATRHTPATEEESTKRLETPFTA